MPLPAVLLGLVPDLIKKGLDIFSQKYQSEGEKQAAAQQFAQEMQTKLQTAWDEEQRQLTERHKADMASDSWMSKNIRPLALVYLMALFTLAFWLDVPETVLAMLRDLLMTVFVFYFGSRTLEKMTKVIKG